jgi:hypothetical protein
MADLTEGLEEPMYQDTCHVVAWDTPDAQVTTSKVTGRSEAHSAQARQHSCAHDASYIVCINTARFV